MVTLSSITAWKISWIFHGKIPYSLASYSPWGCKELDTEQLTHTYGRERQREGKGKERKDRKEGRQGEREGGREAGRKKERLITPI